MTGDDFLMCQVFDLTMREVVGMTGGDLSPAGCIQYSNSMRERLWA